MKTLCNAWPNCSGFYSFKPKKLRGWTQGNHLWQTQQKIQLVIVILTADVFEHFSKLKTQPKRKQNEFHLFETTQVKNTAKTPKGKDLKENEQTFAEEWKEGKLAVQKSPWMKEWKKLKKKLGR